MVPPLAYFAIGGNYPMIRMMKSDDKIGMVPPFARFDNGGNYPMIRIMKFECFPLLPILQVGGTIQ